jgi:3-hydroxyisobutyrate dehydrogenase-like beta-hydroxyacid dehydrogenase
MSIGFIGLGIMGSRMAANLQQHGHALIVYDRTRERAGQLLSRGATWANSPAAVSAQAEVIFTMLAPTQAITDAALGQDGFLSDCPPGRLWVDCSAVAPAFSREMAGEAQARGVRFLDAPVTGSKSQAALATLIFWVGGATSDLEACRPLLDCMGSRITHCGGQSTGASLKMVMDLLLGTGMTAFAKGLVLGESLGLSRAVLFEALLGGVASARFSSSNTNESNREITSPLAPRYAG